MFSDLVTSVEEGNMNVVKCCKVEKARMSKKKNILCDEEEE